MKQEPAEGPGYRKDRWVDPLTLPPAQGTTGWRCPSNIAIVKYWGKKETQLPMNPSLSITLNAAVTETRLEYTFRPGTEPEPLQFTFHGRKHLPFENRVASYLQSLTGLMPHLAYCSLKIESENSFPHSSGIASSASSLGALALCLLQMQEEITGQPCGKERYTLASGLARLGSGSACRSLFPGMALWGFSDQWEGSNDRYAIQVNSYHPLFRGMRDTVLVVESTEKEVSSSEGHRLMMDHPFAAARFDQARSNIGLLKQVLKKGDWEHFLKIAEEETLALHALMMTSRPDYLLLKPASLSILQEIRKFRAGTGIQAGFSMDAGANVHLLHREEDATLVEDFVQQELLSYCENETVIRDRMGNGPARL